MKTLAVLIDFDNIFPRQFSYYSVNDIERVLNFVIENVKASILDVENIIIRLYGGWYENNNLTARASALTSMLSLLNKIFPIIPNPRRIIHGNIELATQLYGHSFIWYNSYREHRGLPKLRIAHEVISEQCDNNKEICPIKILQKFTKNPNCLCNIPGCSTVHSSAFFERKQKYIDTMLACDIITLSRDEDIVGIYVLSDDVDHFPAFAIAHDFNLSKAKMGLFIKNSMNIDIYKSFLSPFDIEVIQII